MLRNFHFCERDTGGNSIFAANANNKVAGILAAYPRAVKEGKELKSVKGVGKGSMDKVPCLRSYPAVSDRRSTHLLSDVCDAACLAVHASCSGNCKQYCIFTLMFAPGSLHDTALHKQG